jgi:hypothetical protein
MLDAAKGLVCRLNMASHKHSAAILACLLLTALGGLGLHLAGSPNAIPLFIGK